MAYKRISLSLDTEFIDRATRYALTQSYNTTRELYRDLLEAGLAAKEAALEQDKAKKVEAHEHIG